jgi:short subunit dehydrogenase-like uncharacterized protein
MSYQLLLYGATGFSGRLIAAEGKSRGMSRGDCRMILAGRDGPRVSRVANENFMEFRVFPLHDPYAIRRGLDGIDVVINAAGPFAFTAEPLARGALEADCHYVDINGELDVYMRLKDLAHKAGRYGSAMVCGAGTSGAPSDVLLDLALQNLLRAQPSLQSLGAVRIAKSKVIDFSRGSAATLARSLREKVIVVRASRSAQKMIISHEPVGKLERAFDFGRPHHDGEVSANDSVPRIASAVNLIDTLVAKNTIERYGLAARVIESYVQLGTTSRIGYQMAAMVSPLQALPAVRRWANAQSALLREGPTPEDMARHRRVIVLEIEDIFHSRVIDWWMGTPSVYELTAQLVVAIAQAVARRRRGDASGWVTPAEALGPVQFGVGPLRGCTLESRTG